MVVYCHIYNSQALVPSEDGWVDNLKVFFFVMLRKLSVFGSHDVLCGLTTLLIHILRESAALNMTADRA